MSDTANTYSTKGQVGMLTPVVTPAQVQATVQTTAAQVVPAAIASVTYSVDPLTRHLIRSRASIDGSPPSTSDIGLVGGSKFWGAYSGTSAFPKASDGVIAGDFLYNQGNYSLYVWQSGGFVNLGSLKGDAGTNASNPNLTLQATALATGSAPTITVSGVYPNQTWAFGIPTGAKGDPGASGVVSASAPLSYNASTKALSIDLSGYVTSSGLTTTLSGYVTTTALNAYGYQTAAQVSASIAAAAPSYSAPLTYNAGTRAVGIQASSTTQDGSMSAAQATQLANLNGAKTLYLLNQTFTVPLIALGGSQSTPYTVPGAQVGMAVVVNPRASTALGPMLYAWVSAANTVSVEIRALVAIAAASIVIDLHVFPNPS